MSFLMLLASGGRRPKVKHSQTFTANGTFPVPVGVSFVDLVGNGGAGSPATTGRTPRTTLIVTFQYRRDGDVDTVQSTASGWVGPGATTGTDQCAARRAIIDSTVYSEYQTCYGYRGGETYSIPASTGPSATAFGKVFPGGVGGPASPATFANVPATAGANYQIVVPVGGSVTVTYWV